MGTDDGTSSGKLDACEATDEPVCRRLDIVAATVYNVLPDTLPSDNVA